MHKYLVWIRLNPMQTAHTFIWADNDGQAKLVAEAQFGVGNVLNYSQVSE